MMTYPERPGHDTDTACRRRHALVTGTSTGIGQATVRRLAAAGFHVFAGQRKPAAADQEVTPLLLDVTDAAARHRAVLRISDHVGDHGLDVLVNNAGIGLAAPIEAVAMDSLRDIFEVDVFAQIALTQALLPQIRLAQGRIVVMGSVGDHITMPFAGPLTASKRALAALADTLRQELAPWSIPVTVIEPGSIKTRAGHKLMSGALEVADALSPEHERLYRKTFLDAVAASVAQEDRGSDPDVVARTVLRAATARRARPRYLSGRFARTLALASALLPTPLLDAVRFRVLNMPGAGSARHVDDAGETSDTGQRRPRNTHSPTH